MIENFSIEDFATDVLRYMEQKQIKTANIFGYSIGGYVAMFLAKNHPAQIKKVFTLGTKFLWTPEIANKEIKMLDPDKINRKTSLFCSDFKRTPSCK